VLLSHELTTPHLLSPKQNLRIRVKIEVDKTTPVPSIISVFPGANWYERETYDLYGVLFSGHPDSGAGNGSFCNGRHTFPEFSLVTLTSVCW
jgi:hypothetical protein